METDGKNIDRVGLGSSDDGGLKEITKVRTPDFCNEELQESPGLQTPTYNLSDLKIPQSHGLYQYPYTLNALEILRETIRILRSNSSSFLSIAVVFICPVSAILLSDAFVKESIVKRLVMRLLLVARSSGLPLTPLIKESCVRLSDMIISYISCFPFLVTFSLTSKAAIVYSVACTYAGKVIVSSNFFNIMVKIWKRVVSTYLWACVVIVGCFALFLVLMIVICNLFSIIGYPSELIVYPALVVAVIFSVAFAHTIIVCNLANVISVLEEASGPQALFRSLFLIKGQTHVGLLIFLGSAIGLAFVEGLFEHRVKTLSYGDGSSRIWEGPLLVVMYSFVVMIDSMMSAVFYFTCRSSSMELTDGEGHGFAELNVITPETTLSS